MIRQRAGVLCLVGAVVTAVVLVAGWVLIREWTELPGVPTDVVRSVASGDAHILAEGSDSSPGNDWEDSYALISVSSSGNPVEVIEEALHLARWSTRAGNSDPLLVSGDTPEGRPKYGVTVQRFDNFNCLDRPGVCGKFEKVAPGQGRDLFVATFMP